MIHFLDFNNKLSLTPASRPFDTVFLRYSLELFDNPEIPAVLEGVKRVLKLSGRIGVVSMSRENGTLILLRLYEWAHMRWPGYLDCRPIYVEQSLKDAGYSIVAKEKVRLFGLPEEVVVSVKAGSPPDA